MMRKLMCCGLLSGSTLVLADAALRPPFDPQRLDIGKGMTRLADMDPDRFELSQLKLAGTLARGIKRLALLQDPQQRVYTVAIGSLLGNGRWQVTAIGEAHITLRQTSPESPPAATETHLHMENP